MARVKEVKPEVKDEQVQETAQETTQAKKQSTVKHIDVYSYDELVASYKVFGVAQECVMAALKFNRVTHCDVETAKKLIDKFMRRVIV